VPAVGARLQADDSPAELQVTSRAFETPGEGPQDVGCLVADRKDLARLFHLGGDSFSLHQGDQFGGTEGSEGGMQETPLVTVGPDDAATVGVVGEIAACATRHEDLDPGAGGLFEQGGAQAPFGRAGGGQQARGPRPHHCDIELGHAAS